MFAARYAMLLCHIETKIMAIMENCFIRNENSKTMKMKNDAYKKRFSLTSKNFMLNNLHLHIW